MYILLVLAATGIMRAYIQESNVIPDILLPGEMAFIVHAVEAKSRQNHEMEG